MAPAWAPVAVFLSVFAALTAMAFLSDPGSLDEMISVAFIGNSMLYINDFPRFMEALSNGHIKQNSCLRGGSNLASLPNVGNGMYKKWNTELALMDDGFQDFGACSIRQLLFGYDDDIVSMLNGCDDDDEMCIEMVNDEINPCSCNETYLTHVVSNFQEALVDSPPSWDYVFLNDNTRYPAYEDTMEESVSALVETYVPWFQETGATPVFMDTYAHWSPYRDYPNLENVPDFTNRTYEGYLKYAEVVGSYLPERQRPRVAPVGLAFLTVWEEERDIWNKLFHSGDLLHPSKHGTFLQGCVVHYTLFGRMPLRAVALRDKSYNLWARARRMQSNKFDWQMPNLTISDAKYLFNVAERVAKGGHVPKSLHEYSDENEDAERL